MRKISLAMLALLPFVLGACDKDMGVGEPCLPEPIPCDDDGKQCGFRLADTFVQTNAPACEARTCVVHRLDNGTNDQVPADPRLLCEEDGSTGCVPRAALEQAVHCTCRCAGPKGPSEDCECPDGFVCKELSSDPAQAWRGSYCVRPR